MFIELTFWLSCSISIPHILPEAKNWVFKDDSWIYEMTDWRIIVEMTDQAKPPIDVTQLDPNAQYRINFALYPHDSPSSAQKMFELVGNEILKGCGKGVLQSPEGYEFLELKQD
jgi:hypothetical protein